MDSKETVTTPLIPKPPSFAEQFFAKFHSQKQIFLPFNGTQTELLRGCASNQMHMMFSQALLNAHLAPFIITTPKLFLLLSNGCNKPDSKECKECFHGRANEKKRLSANIKYIDTFSLMLYYCALFCTDVWCKGDIRTKPGYDDATIKALINCLIDRRNAFICDAEAIKDTGIDFSVNWEKEPEKYKSIGRAKWNSLDACRKNGLIQYTLRILNMMEILIISKMLNFCKLPDDQAFAMGFCTTLEEIVVKPMHTLGQKHPAIMGLLANADGLRDLTCTRIHHGQVDGEKLGVAFGGPDSSEELEKAAKDFSKGLGYFLIPPSVIPYMMWSIVFNKKVYDTDAFATDSKFLRPIPKDSPFKKAPRPKVSEVAHGGTRSRSDAAPDTASAQDPPSMSAASAAAAAATSSHQEPPCVQGPVTSDETNQTAAPCSSSSSSSSDSSPPAP